MDMMKPISRKEVPVGEDWLYEVKYDGFRCQLAWDKAGDIQMYSKNGKNLTAGFPEILESCESIYPSVKQFLPVLLDGELIVPNHAYQSNFSLIQKRGRLKSEASITVAAKRRHAMLMVFDMLEYKGQSVKDRDLLHRKKLLDSLAAFMGYASLLQAAEPFEDRETIKNIVFAAKSEGIVAKRKSSRYVSGKSHHDWYKIKNWRTIKGILTGYNSSNGYYDISVYNNNGEIMRIGTCKHGLDNETSRTLRSVFIQNGNQKGAYYHLQPAIAAEINTLDLYEGELREPEFARLIPEIQPSECTSLELKMDIAMLPKKAVDIRNTSKVFWTEKPFMKGDLLFYMREIAPYMLPFLENRLLTLIRCPDGIHREHFYQKHLPEYAPPFLEGWQAGEEQAILCNNLESLIWLANHGAVEYPIPFQEAGCTFPSEIVFDLDPPDSEHFHLAITAANLIKPMLDELKLISYVKTSGNKGLQIYIPLPEDSLSYEQTAIFTQAIAWSIENTFPDSFTTERMKKNRGGRLYIDYVQHGRDKTIVCPYSPRMTVGGTVAAPLFWEEVNEGLHPEQFTIENVPARVKALGCPFQDYRTARKMQNIDRLQKLIQG